MGKVLNITNGDCAVAVMRQAGVKGDILPWRDVLHEGPVPENLSLDELAEVRARFIAERGWGEFEKVKKGFRQRDDVLRSFNDYDAVVLWFEHDLYDQLQILQILDWFAEQDLFSTRLSMICSETYLGPTTPEELIELKQYEKLVSDEQLQLARESWAAFRAPSPLGLQDLLQEDTSALPFLDAVIRRLMEEFPDDETGLSRTAYQALKIIHAGESHAGKIFAQYQESEQRRFLGDSSFWVLLYEMLEATPPLLTLPENEQLTLPTTPQQQLSITPAGIEVLQAKRSWFDMHQLDRWIGGVHLTPHNIWSWNKDLQTLLNCTF